MSTRLDESLNRSRRARQHRKSLARSLRNGEAALRGLQYTFRVLKYAPNAKPLVVLEKITKYAADVTKAKAEDEEETADMIDAQIQHHEAIDRMENFEKTGYTDVEDFFETDNRSNRSQNHQQGSDLLPAGSPMGELRRIDEQKLKRLEEKKLPDSDHSEASEFQSPIAYHAREFYERDPSLAVSSIT